MLKLRKILDFLRKLEELHHQLGIE